jgi:GntR family transcriptional regulator, transcriptional repressor for pyruvate dehydrogenase complex
MTPPLNHASVSDLVFTQLRDAILSGRYEPGERLPTQRALAADLDVNMTTVRQALGRLEQLRLVETRHGDATRVLDWRTSGGLEALAVLSATDLELIPPLFEARRVLLAQSARLAAERRTDTQARGLHELVTAIESAADDKTALFADWAFMSTVVEAAENLVFQLIMNSVRQLYLPNLEAFVSVVAEREQLLPLYRRTADAIEAGDSDAAARALDELAGAQEQRMLRGR